MFMITWAAEAGQQVVVGGWGLVGQGGERWCCRGKLGQLRGKVTRKTWSSLTKKKGNVTNSKLGLICTVMQCSQVFLHCVTVYKTDPTVTKGAY